MGHQFDDMEREFAAVVAWLTEMDLDVSSTYLTTLASDLRDAVEVVRRQEIGRFADPQSYRRLTYGLLEALDWIRVHRAFQNERHARLHYRLKQAVRGPPPGDDADSGNEASGRNYLAELSWGALLHAAEQRVDLSGETDVISIHRLPFEVAVLWEVKRPQSIRAVSKRITEAKEQIGAVVTGVVPAPVSGDLAGGAAVLSMDFLMLDRRPVLVSRASAAAKERVAEELQRWRDDNSHLLSRTHEQGYRGVVLWWRLLGVVNRREDGRPLLTEVQQVLFDNSGARTDDWAALALQLGISSLGRAFSEDLEP